ncbi:MAG: hypothetical protein J5666_02715 [Bacilli bacterium]|nr:hypothetical protein [Bacilli bacterium]
MKKYFIYFSYTGNGDYLASLMKEDGFEIVKVEPLKPLAKLNFFRMLALGGDAMFQKKRPIKELGIKINSEDEVVIGSPIWNDRLSTPINTILETLTLDKEKTQFILYPAGSNTKKSLAQIKKLGFVQEPIVIQNPLKYQEEAAQKIKLAS